jgi:hypothetical protein
MIFSVQRFLEDHFERRGLSDVDQYAIKVANVFERLDPNTSKEDMARELGRLRTAFYRRNHELDRRHFEAGLAATLRKRFKKKRPDASFMRFKSGFALARARLRTKRRKIGAVLLEFKKAVEARAVDAFWKSRKKHLMRSRPEKIAQALLAVFAKGVVGSNGVVLREIASGIGFVDIGVSFGGPLHLIELKILKTNITGASQLATYMKTEGRNTGWLVLIDARKGFHRDTVPVRIKMSEGLIRTLVIKVNPVVPHATR